MTAWSRKTWNFFWAIFAFFCGKTTTYGKFHNSVMNEYMATPIKVVMLKCRNIIPTCIIYLTKQVAQLLLTNLCDSLHHDKRQNFKTLTWP